MTMQTSQTQKDCPVPEISAYIDAELSPRQELETEKHLAVCNICSAELNHQKGFLLALNVSLKNGSEIELPRNFAKTIVANAESHVTGLRLPKERFTAVIICMVLFLFVVAALGGDAETVFIAFAAVIEKLLAAGSLVLNFVYFISLSTAVITRSLASQLLSNSALSFDMKNEISSPFLRSSDRRAVRAYIPSAHLRSYLAPLPAWCRR